MRSSSSPAGPVAVRSMASASMPVIVAAVVSGRSPSALAITTQSSAWSPFLWADTAATTSSVGKSSAIG